MNTLNTLTVYLGSSGHTRPVFRHVAENLGTLIGRTGKTLVYGGMDAGLMGLLANTALESGAAVTGIIPKQLKDSERIHPRLTETILVDTLWERKLRMFLRADAVIVLPGGFGTLDECLEVLWWGHLGLHQKPLVLVNIDGYWDPVLEYLKTLPDFNARYLIVAPGVEEAFEAMEGWSAEGLPANAADGYPHFEDDILSEEKTPIILRDATVSASYRFITALGLKQLGKHTRALGILTQNTRLEPLVRWIDRAAAERFITLKC
ncbi:MAG: TIGR00730 family Rossman fold protein, partial [Alphaproteobacteria bacterium]|nr:TIGR00730 family Rossman fold protein [Alphaproteobacteria bacterium]